MHRKQYRTMIFLLFLLAAVLLGGCRTSRSPGQTEAERKTAGSSEDSGPSVETAAVEKPHNRETIYEKNGLRLELSMEYHPTTPQRSCYLIGTVEDGTDRNYTIDSVIVNNLLQTGKISGSVKGKTSENNQLIELSQDIQLAGITEISSLSFHLSISDENYEIIDESDETVEFAPPLVYAPSGNLEITSACEGQILQETEDVRLKIIYCGTDPNYRSDNISLVIEAENRSAYEKRINVNGCTVNKRNVEFYANGQTVQGGKTCYVDMEINSDSLQTQDIDAIREMSFLISTTKSDLNGGGVWCSLELASENEKMSSDDTAKILLDSWGEVSVYLLQETPKVYASYESELYYSWNILIDNQGTENLVLDCVSEKAEDLLTGEELTAEALTEDGLTSDFCLYFEEGTVGRESSLTTQIICSSKVEMPPVSITGSIAFYKNGRQEFLHTGKEFSLPDPATIINPTEGVTIYPSDGTFNYENDRSWIVWPLVIFNETDKDLEIQTAHLRWSGKDQGQALTDGDIVLTDNRIASKSAAIMKLKIASSLLSDGEIKPEVSFSCLADGNELKHQTEYFILVTE